jgi:hypothetical protein
MNADSPASKASRALSSSEVERPGGAAEELASLPITASAFSVGPCFSSIASGPERIGVPALSISALAQTMKPS